MNLTMTPALGTPARHDAVLIATGHTAVDYGLVAREVSLIVDTRGVFRDPRDNLVRA